MLSFSRGRAADELLHVSRATAPGASSWAEEQPRRVRRPSSDGAPRRTTTLRPARAPSARRWLRVCDDAARAPQWQLRSCVALAIALHSCLPTARWLMDAVYYSR